MLKALEEAQHELARARRYRSVITAAGRAFCFRTRQARWTCNASAERILGSPTLIGERRASCAARDREQALLLEEMHPATETLRTGKPRSAWSWACTGPMGRSPGFDELPTPVSAGRNHTYAVVTCLRTSPPISARRAARARSRTPARPPTDLIPGHARWSLRYASPAVRPARI
jgi:hypothetical protein